MVYLRPPKGSAFAAMLNHCDTLERALSGIFALAGAESVAEVYVAGQKVYSQNHLGVSPK
jgi:hypothetical protein